MASANEADDAGRVGRVIGLIPARAGSKGIPGKNTRLLAGKPLLQHTIEAALESAVFDRLVLTTESSEIAALGRELGAEVPFMRPSELAQDETPMLPVIEHALGLLTGDESDIVVLLQPTAPLRSPAHLRAAVDLLASTGCDSVVTVVALPRHYSPDFVLRLVDGRLEPFVEGGLSVGRRQDARRAYSRDGTVYAFRRRTVGVHGTIYGRDCRPIVLDQDESANLDSMADWERAERILQRRARPGTRSGSG